MHTYIRRITRIVWSIGIPVLSLFPASLVHADDSFSSPNTRLMNALTPLLAQHPGLSGFYLLSTGDDALDFRLSMIECAERNIDIQYYMVQADNTGKLVLDALLHAADRGVRVRMLIDDFNFRRSDRTWLALNSHKNIEIKIFNPFSTREDSLLTRIVTLFSDAEHLTHRMHNKALIVDNQIAVAGGRNLGDAYFDASTDFNFHDVDIFTVGPIVPYITRSFERYWKNKEAYPLTQVISAAKDPLAKTWLHKTLNVHWQKEEKDGLITAAPSLIKRLQSEKLALTWAKAELAVDPPAKIDAPIGTVQSRPAYWLDKLTDDAQKEVTIVTAYLVPGEEGVEWLKDLVKRGVKVRILTNSLASIDAVAAFTGYHKYRKELLAAGVELYEMRPIPGTHPHSRHYSSAARASLHSKIYMIDRRDVIIGSFNLDPRSIDLNTEMVLIIHSPELAGQLEQRFEQALATSFRVTMDSDNRLDWSLHENNQEKHFKSEPFASIWRKMEASLLGLLPIEQQL